MVLTTAAYWPVRHHPFINFDDPQYVAENAPVLDGLTQAGVAWAFSTGHAGNWHPLTWLSHMLDVELFGVDPGAHHTVSLVLHVLTTLVLFWILWRTTAAPGRSAFVAAIFALHPLHVESVAWIAERKDVLSALFFMLTIAAYVSYARRPSVARYAIVVICFALGLMAKPMLVTLPFVLLLLDVWPLQRTKQSMFEKIPLFALAIASSIVTFLVQQQAGAVRTFDALPFTTRLANAVVAYVAYLWKAIWPTGLAPIYPYPASQSILVVLGAAAFLAAITWAAWRWRRDRPYLLVGWLWYLGMLVPVIGLIQVGSQPIADRYTYLPLVGLSIAVAWGLPRRSAAGAKAGAIAAAGVVIALAIGTRWQVSHWRTSIALWEHAVDAVPGNYRAHVNLGHALESVGKIDEAIAHDREALRIKPDYAEAHNNLGGALLERRRPAEAVIHLLKAVQLSPRYVTAHNNLGLALAATQQPDEAIAHFKQAVQLNPLFAPAHGNLGVALAQQGRFDEAVTAFREALRLQPDVVQARQNLARSLHERGRALAALGRHDEALASLLEAAPITRAAWPTVPAVAEVYYDAADVLVQLKRIPDALRMLEAALLVDPNHAEARAAAQALLKAGR